MKREGKLYYSIGEVAEMLGLSTSLLRYWEKEFPNIKPSMNSAGKRIYKDEDIQQVRIIQYLLKEKKMTIEGAKQHLKGRKHTFKENMSNVSVVDELLKIKEQLYEIRKSLTLIEEQK